jgi:hypothetical protein
MNHKTSSTCNESILDNDNTNNVAIHKQQPRIHDRVKLIYVDDKYSGLTEGVCGTVSSIFTAKDVSRSINRPESIVWVKWDNGSELGLIEGIDKYEVISRVITNSKHTAKSLFPSVW